MKLGVLLPFSGADATRDRLLDRARELEQAGFAGLWVSDHVVQPARIESRYPYAADGKATWDSTIAQLEVVITLAAAAAVTEKVELGTAVLVLPQRQPVLLAKQLATVATLAPGRLVVGTGAGWLEEEFQALGADFSARGAIFDEWLDVLRECWTGRPAAREGFLSLPADIVVAPAPDPVPPLLVGGMSPRAFRRAVEHGDGWIAQAACTPEGVVEVLLGVEGIRNQALRAGRDLDGFRFAARLSGQTGPETGSLLRTLANGGVTEVILNTPAPGSAAQAYQQWQQALV